MTELLRCHPEIILPINVLYAFLKDAFWEENIDFEHFCDLNWHGRYLMDKSARAPLSLWPLVFENVNKSKECNDKPSVIYELLKGPAFAARNDGSV